MTIIKKKEQNKNETNHKQISQNRPCGWSQARNKTISSWSVFKSDGSAVFILPTTWGKLPNLVQWTKTWNSVTKCLCVISRNNNHHQHNHSHNHGGGQHERDIEDSVWKEDVGGCRGVKVRNKERKKRRKKRFLKTIQSLKKKNMRKKKIWCDKECEEAEKNRQETKHFMWKNGLIGMRKIQKKEYQAQ